MGPCSVVWYSECLYGRSNAPLFDNSNACASVAVLYCVILWGSVPMWPWYFIWYCQCLYQWGRALLCDTVSAFTDVAMLRCLIIPMLAPVWQCSVAWFCQCLYQCGIGLLRLIVIGCPMCQCIFDGECYYYHRWYHFSGPLMPRKNSLIHTHIRSRFFRKFSQENA